MGETVAAWFAARGADKTAAAPPKKTAGRKRGAGA
jgi:hypothetical protein